MRIVTSLLNRFGFFAALKLRNISFGYVLTVIRTSFPRVHANAAREWYSPRDAQRFQMNMLQRRDMNVAVSRRPIAR
jgi:hypothetical protein